jgi:ribosomal-protein-alanine N-acetyltransferase
MITSIISFSSEKINFQPINKNQIERITEGFNDSEVMKFFPISHSEIEFFLSEIIYHPTDISEPSEIWYSIIDKETNQFMGITGLNKIEHQHSKAEMSLWLFKDFWGKGVWGESVRAFSRFAFDQLQLNRIEIFIDSRHESWYKKAVSNLKYLHEGCLRDFEFKNGQFISYDVFSMLKSESYQLN